VTDGRVWRVGVPFLETCVETQSVAVWCSVLQCAAVCCSVLQCIAVCCSVLQCVALCCSALKCVAVCCNVLQSVLQTLPDARFLLLGDHANQPVVIRANMCDMSHSYV